MMRDTGSSTLVYLAWIVGGLLSLFGAMTYAELGAMLPYAGGEYVYLRGAYGDTPAFLYMWTWFAVAKPASIAAVTIGLARTLEFFPAFHWLTNAHRWALPIALVADLRHRRHLVHDRTELSRHQKGRRLPTCLHHPQRRPDPDRCRTLLRLSLRLVLQTSPPRCPTPLAASADSCWRSSPRCGPTTAGTTSPWSPAKSAAPSAAFPSRSSAASSSSAFSFMATNAAIQYILPAAQIAASERPAVAALSVVAGPRGAGFVAAAMALSIFVTLNGTMMSGARIPFAAARDRLFFRQFAHINPRFQSPSTSLIVQGLLSTVLLLFLSQFQQHFELAVFAEWLFYMLTATTVFVYRRRRPDLARPYRVWGYPVLPAIFVLCAAAVLVYSYAGNLRGSLLGTALILLGLPVLWLVRKIYGASLPPSSC